MPKDKIERAQPTALQRREYLKADKDRFRRPENAGSPRGLFDHDPYEPQATPNPSARATTTLTVEYDGEMGEVVIPKGTLGLDAKGRPLFETMETLSLEGESAGITGAIACEPGATGNIDIHTIVALKGFPRAHFNVTNPFPGTGGADVRDGVEVLGEGEPDKPRLRELAEYAEEKGGLSDTGDREVLTLLSSIPANDLPEPWFYVVSESVRQRRLVPQARVIAFRRYGHHQVLALAHRGLTWEKAAFRFEGHVLREVTTEDVEDVIHRLGGGS